MSPAPIDFAEGLEPTLVLTIDGTAHSIPGAQVRSLRVDVTSWGFEAEVLFWLSTERSEDELLEPFLSAKPIEASLTIDRLSPPDGSTATPIVVKGIVTSKEVFEHAIDAVTGAPVLHRRYKVVFRDPARVLWGQHFPCELYVDKSLKDVIDAHKGDKITITYDWSDQLDSSRPMIFLPLGAGTSDASFYDFVVWLAETRCGVFAYDAATNAYELSAEKDSSGTASSFVFQETGEIRIEFPETPRAAAAVLNSFVDAAQKTDATPANANAVSGVKRDVLVREPISADVTARAGLEGKRLASRDHELVVKMRAWPTMPFLPGALAKLSHEPFGTNIYASGKTYRIRELHLRTQTESLGPVIEGASASHACELILRLEVSTEAWVPLPPHVAPRWPAFVEGLIVSEQGEDSDETWQKYTDSNTSIDSYKVKVPLWSNLVVLAPFESNTLPGHLFFPPYKKARVLLELSFLTARIERFLDWRAGAALPLDTQGNHILVGKSAKSNTSISHVYDDQKPVLLVLRTNDKDTQTIKLEDGVITIQTKENQ